MEQEPKSVVLVVEDEPLVRMLYGDVLEEAGFKVVTAADASEALAILAARPDIAVMLTDVNMPGDMDGLALARYAGKRWPNLAVLVLSGRVRPSPEDVPRGCLFIPKPCPNPMLVRHVRAAEQRMRAAIAPRPSMMDGAVHPDAPGAIVFPHLVSQDLPHGPAGLQGGASPAPEPDRS